MLFSLSTYGHAFSTRPRGIEVLREFERKAAGQDKASVDFALVRHISYSFADEFVGALMQNLQEGAYRFDVEFVNVPPKFQRLIDASLSSRGVSTPVVAG